MLGRLLIAASVAALLSAAPALAEQSQQPIYKPQSGEGGQEQGTMGGKSGQSGQAGSSQKIIQPDASGTNQATGEQPATEGEQATGETGQKTKKLQQPGNQEAAGQGTEGAGQGQKTKKIQQQTGQDTGKAKTEEGQQATGEAGQKTKKVEQGQQSDQMQTGTTGKVSTEITAENKTVIRQKIMTTNVRRIDRTKIDIDINVGVIVPTTIELYPLPATVVEVVPAYENYLYFVLADGTIVIVQPGTLQIAYVIAA